MKIFLLILLVILIMTIAIGVTKQFKQRNNIFNSILQFLNQYELNIGFKKEKIKVLVDSFKANSDAKMIFDKYLVFLSNGQSLDFDEVRVLLDDEKKSLVDIFNKLGTTDYENEISKLKIHKEYVQSKIQETTLDKNKCCPLIIKLSLLFALGVVLILI